MENINTKEFLLEQEKNNKDYYENPIKKITDFLTGFGGYLLLCYLSIRLFGVISIILLLILYFILPVYFFREDRKFIAYGILFVALIPVILILGGAGGMSDR